MTKTVLNNDHCLLKLKMPTDILLLLLLLLLLIHAIHCLSVTITNQPELLLGPGTLILHRDLFFVIFTNVFVKNQRFNYYLYFNECRLYIFFIIIYCSKNYNYYYYYYYHHYYQYYWDP